MSIFSYPNSNIMKIILILSFIFGIFIVSCNDPCKVSLKNDLLLNCWTHSSEESVGVDGLLFRPCDFMNFPEIEFRTRFTLQEDNKAIFLQMSPVDNHQLAPGTWNYDDVLKILTIKHTSGDTVYNFLVINLEEDKLILKPN